jgi:type II secretory ATPase GspE/PulE/Tfp pilus assembly ATPase PilB-like protein
MTLEDPVEYQINGINQVQINPVAGLTFASGLRSFLRQDPNVILIGEIRDTETTQLAVQAALTGHLVFATLHTNSASTAIPRLIDLGAEPFLVSSALLAAIAQRIARQICPHCKMAYTPTPEELALIAHDLPSSVTTPPTQLYKGRGCEQCDHSGYYGRLGIFEVLTMTPTVNQLVIQHATAGDIEKQACLSGMTTMRQDGMLKVLGGLTTIEEILRLTQ